ncbi:tetratricopeptide repeat protein [Hylemonella sp. W303a]|uniref:tetratricopeptide repeat protein n=1 Tax=Hylemonella sp. W303a TaxID=3389873 RepID=UPI00396B3D60
MSALRPRLPALILPALLALLPTTQAAPATPSKGPTAVADLEAPTPVENSMLNGELFYQLLLGELSVQQGETGAAYSLLLNAARKTNDGRLYQRAIDIALRARAGESALLAARDWTKAQPESAEANRYVLQILLGLNRLDDTVGPLQRALALSAPAERPLLIATLPLYFSRSSDKALAASVLEQALQSQLLDPAQLTAQATPIDKTTSAAAWSAVGRMRLAADNPAGVLEAARRGVALDPRAPEPLLLAMALLSPQLPARYAPQREEAQELLARHFASTSSATPNLRLYYARALVDIQRYAEAQAQLKTILQAQPDLTDAWLLQGMLELQDKRLSNAEKSLKRFIELIEAQRKQAIASTGTEEDDDDEADDAQDGSPVIRRQDGQQAIQRAMTQAYLGLAQIAEQRKDYKAAEAWLARINTGGNAAEQLRVQKQRASLLARQNRMDDALALIRGLPDNTPEGARDKFYAELQLLRDNKRYAQAYALLEGATRNNPQDYDLLYEQSMMAEKLGRAEEMERLLRRIMAEKPDYHHAYNALGYFFADRNMRLAEARALIQKALDAAPGDPFITDSLAWVTFREGNKEEALRLLTQAYTDRPDAEIAAHLGEVLWSLGQRDEARKIWREGLELNASNETLLETLQRLGVKKP